MTMRRRFPVRLLFLSLVFGVLPAAVRPGLLSASEFDHAHTLFGKVLDAFVLAEGEEVDYAGLKRDPADLKAYLDQLASVSREAFREWSAPEQIAFLTNLYNAATLKLIIDHYPVESIRKIWPLWKNPWKQEVVRLFGDSVTLDHVEHDLLRKDYEEPRVHFALVCAARSCPPLRREPYVPARLDEQFEDQGRIFLNTPSKNRVDLESRTVYLSKIFQWFSEDFTDSSGSVLAFVRPYFREEIPGRLAEGSFRIEYLDYDWSLNDRR